MAARWQRVGTLTAVLVEQRDKLVGAPAAKLLKHRAGARDGERQPAARLDGRVQGVVVRRHRESARDLKEHRDGRVRVEHAEGELLAAGDQPHDARGDDDGRARVRVEARERAHVCEVPRVVDHEEHRQPGRRLLRRRAAHTGERGALSAAASHPGGHEVGGRILRRDGKGRRVSEAGGRGEGWGGRRLGAEEQERGGARCGCVPGARRREGPRRP